MPFSPTDLRHMQHAQGYLELGMLQDAAAEMDRVRPEVAEQPKVMGLRLAIANARREWPLCVALAQRLARAQPDLSDWPVALAYATRRAVSIHAARPILLEALRRFPEDAILHFNLGCYAAQLGELDEARRRVRRAIALDRAYRELARTDPDLEPIRTSFEENPT